MKRKAVSVLAAASIAASLLTGAVPMTVLADGTMVVSIGADLTEDQKTAILKYFGIYGNNSVQTITVTNQDERNHLASYIPIEQIGTRTISCALVKPTTSGGVQVKTANLDYITSNMIASNLVTCGVTNCQAIAAAPFEVSGTGALTGILMAYENATGTQISQQAKDLSAQEIEITEDLSGATQNQQIAQQIVNDVKLQVIDGTVDSVDNSQNTDNSVINDNSVDNSSVSNIVNNVVNNYTTNNGVSLTDEEVQKLTDYAVQLAQQAYEKGAEDAKAQVQAQAEIQKNLSDQTGVSSTDTTTQIIDNATQGGTSSDSTPASESDQQTASSETAGSSGSEDASSDSSDDIFSKTDVSALNDGDTQGTLVTGTDSSVISNDTAEGAKDNDAVISGNEDASSAESDSTSETTAQTDASGLVITTQDSSTLNDDGSGSGTQAPVSDGTDNGAAAEIQTPDGTDGAAAETQPSVDSGDAAVQSESAAAAEDAGTSSAVTITADQTDSYSTSYLNDGTSAHVSAFVLALRADNLVPVSGTLTVSDGSGNVLGTADLSDRSQAAAVSSGTANDEFKSNNGWDQLTGLFFQPKDASGNVVSPAAGTNYTLTLNGTFAQTSDPSQTDGAPTVAVDLENLSYSEQAPAYAGLDLGQTSLSALTAGAGVSGTVSVDAGLQAQVSSPDGTAAVSTADGTGTVTPDGDPTVTVTLNASGLAEVDVTYTAAAADTQSSDDILPETDADGNVIAYGDDAAADETAEIGTDAAADTAATDPVTVRYFIPVQAQ